ncbi:hypothetical protein B0G82_2096 [Paraburkholderia sp. BL17N1]|nr:hypothetical protein B0G82_2096 [Paraburkholderia sp. BL17N1]
MFGTDGTGRDSGVSATRWFPRRKLDTQLAAGALIAKMTGSATAELGASALTHMSGNVGVNTAAGVSGAPLNGLAIH